jgi:Putative DNA-binding domain
VIQKAFDATDNHDVEALVADRVRESKTLEYKQELPGSSDKQKKEFLADVSSFSNASGGDVLFGVKEARDSDDKKTGEPEAVVPLTGTTADEAKLRLEEIIRNGIDPRLPVQIRDISGFGDDGQDFVLLIRIPKSLAAPHVVTYGGAFTFFSRHSAGKYPLDVQELRAAFLATQAQQDHIRRFRENRLAKIVADETPVRLSTRHRLVLHLIPISSFLSNDRLDLSNLQNAAALFPPLKGYGHRRFNLDGIVTHNKDTEDGTNNDAYCQLFFNGVVESVLADLIRGTGGARPGNGVGGIASVAYEQDVIQAITTYLKSYGELGIVPPISISMALLNCKGSYLYVSQRIFLSGTSMPIDRDAAILPDIVVERLDVDVAQAMRPVFNAVWNACGYPRSFNYNEHGDWSPQH